MTSLYWNSTLTPTPTPTPPGNGIIAAKFPHYSDVIMGTIASQITSLTIVYSTVYSDADLRKYQSSAPLAFVWGFHRGPVNSPHKWPVMRRMLPFMLHWYNSMVYTISTHDKDSMCILKWVSGDKCDATVFLVYDILSFRHKGNLSGSYNKNICRSYIGFEDWYWGVLTWLNHVSIFYDLFNEA